ncbi:D-serine ammonia-lyase [Trueperella pecoris]|uniref:D-serine ammonia-lyase n=1 Tax=Trueperella pecoris TaxID=2733571 RepID=UPI001ABEAD2B|nr:D-serine ammonia-lyase [Trueperella pecoris]QTG75801.1 D-serine ammonia-lyase [Trueperella pecoris]
MSDNTNILGKPLSAWIEDYPLIENLVNLEETSWFNPAIKDASEGLKDVGLTTADIEDARDRLKRFAPYIARVFPESRPLEGIIESPLRAVPDLKKVIEDRTGVPIRGQLWAKLDSNLPISGSIKARGGIYEVLQHAENLAIEAGLITTEDDYTKFDSDEFREFFSQYKVAVGSTGNLGLSIGIMSAQLGFQAFVHMSADARAWKKAKLRSHGVTVVEYESDYSIAVAEGRKQAQSDPKMYFVDDENSVSLFLGYAVSGARVAGQLQAADIRISPEKPLFVYLPCGVGGGPGGVAFGLKAALGDSVRCIFVEPTHSPAMFLGVYTGEHDGVSVQDFGIDNLTAADGLAVGRPSGFVGSRMQYLLDGYFTVTDEEMYRYVALMYEHEGTPIEPSSATGLRGAQLVENSPEYLERIGVSQSDLDKCCHLAWITGGAMVPQDEMMSYVERGKALL